MRAMILVCLTASLAAPAIADHATFDPASVPFVSDEGREDIAGLMDEAVAYRHSALAVAPGGRWEWAGGDEDNATEEDLRRRALERCEHVSRTPCHLVWSNGVFLWQEGGAPQPQGLVYGGAFDPARVPFVSAVYHRDGMKGSNSLSYKERPGHKALALNRLGRWRSRSGLDSPEAAAQQALDACNDGKPERACFVYAIDDQVVWTLQTPLR